MAKILVKSSKERDITLFIEKQKERLIILVQERKYFYDTQDET